jgi:mannose-6-phosphate isomerase-like protein (cupin superfamily)
MSNQEIIISENNAEGLSWLYDNKTWTVGIKNWKPANDVAELDCVEKHNETDELFILLQGRCVLLQAYDQANSAEGLDITKIEMQANKLYQIPAGLWHNTVTWPDTKLVIIENSNTGMHNSEIKKLDTAGIAEVRAIK